MEEETKLGTLYTCTALDLRNAIQYKRNENGERYISQLGKCKKTGINLIASVARHR